MQGRQQARQHGWIRTCRTLPKGSRFLHNPAMTEEYIIVNAGGEGEIAGAINLNNLIATIRPIEEIRRAGLIIVHDMLEVWPFADESVDEVIGNSLPGFDASERLAILQQAYRVLKHDGKVRMQSMSISPLDWKNSIRIAGFADILLETRYGYRHAVGRKI